MIIRIAAPVAWLATSTACATTEPGWSGNGATPFGTAERLCHAEATAQPSEARDAAFLGCMQRQGWTRGG